jgi:hypothetical protein
MFKKLANLRHVLIEAGSPIQKGEARGVRVTWRVSVRSFSVNMNPLWTRAQRPEVLERVNFCLLLESLDLPYHTPSIVLIIYCSVARKRATALFMHIRHRVELCNS